MEWEPVISVVGFAVAYYGSKLGKTKWQRGLIWFVVLGAAFAGMVFEGRSFWWFD